jgi:hypothetical protein
VLEKRPEEQQALEFAKAGHAWVMEQKGVQ